MKPEDSNDQGHYLVVPTAQRAPSWMSWAMYAVIVFNVYLYTQGYPWVPYFLAIMAGGMTYAFYSTYNALVRIYNETRINEAIRSHFHAQQEGQEMAQLEHNDPLNVGAKVTGPGTTKVDPEGKGSDESETLERYRLALFEINEKCTNISDARDIAWSALQHDTNEALKAKESAHESKGS